MRPRIDAQHPHRRRRPADVDHVRYHRVMTDRPVAPVLVHAEGADDVGPPLLVEARVLQDDVGTNELLRSIEKPVVQQALGEPD